MRCIMMIECRYRTFYGGMSQSHATSQSRGTVPKPYEFQGEKPVLETISRVMRSFWATYGNGRPKEVVLNEGATS